MFVNDVKAKCQRDLDQQVNIVHNRPHYRTDDYLRDLEFPYYGVLVISGE